MQAYTLGPCTKITACSRTAFPPNPSWMDPCWLSKLMSGDLQPADLSIKQCSLFEPRGRRFRPSSTDKVVVTSASHLLIDIDETKANVSTKVIFFGRINLIKDTTVVGVSKFNSSMRSTSPSPFLYRISLSLELLSKIIYLTAKKKNPAGQSPCTMWWHNSLRVKVKGKREMNWVVNTQQMRNGFPRHSA